MMDQKNLENTVNASWAKHYEQLHDKYEKLCDALYKIVGLEEHEIETCVWVAKDALKDAGEWPR